MITTTVQTQSLTLILNEKTFSQITTYGPVWNSDSWTWHSNQNFPVNGALGGIGENPMIQISVPSVGIQSFYLLEP